MTTPIAIDLEWPADSEELVPPLVSIAWAGVDGAGIMTHDDPRVEPLAISALERGWIGANVPGDLFVLLKHTRGRLLPYIIRAYHERKIYDVNTREKMIDIAEGWY